MGPERSFGRGGARCRGAARRPRRICSAGRRLWAAALALVACSSGSNVRRFADAPPVWRIDDRRPFSPRPEEFYSPFIWDGANYSTFRPLARVWTFPQPMPAQNVNSMDEVPNSSWFTNRLSVRNMTPRELARGACPHTDDAAKVPWVVVAGKPDGANPGFQVVDARGIRALVKVDGVTQPERATAADALGAVMFHAAGYWAPCNRVTFIRKEHLKLEEGAEIKRTNGTVEPLTREAIDTIMSKATEVEPGLFRVSISEFISGRPIGPWRYEGVRKDDPNDVIPHQHRRELRGMRLLAAWTDHIDTRQENTMLAWISTGKNGEGFTRHYRIDFGDMFGLINGPPGVPERFGHVGYFSPGQMMTDFLALGLIDRPWHDKRMGPAGPALGYWRAEPFDVDPWHPGYPNPAFDRATEADLAWMARIIARFTPAHVDALVQRAHFRSKIVHAEVIRIMNHRRQRILDRYLTRLSPLTWPQVRGRKLCLQDLAVWTGIRDETSRRYQAVAHVEGVGRSEALDVRAGSDARVCAELPEVQPGRYAVVVFRATSGEDGTFPLWAHFTGHRDGWRLVGLERPEHAEAPAL